MYKVLIVDDEPLVQVGIKSMLNWEQLNMEICGIASNGEIALKIIEEESPEIVITDIKMPVLSGLELIRECRERYGNSKPQFIILTSYEDFHMAKEAMKYQVADYLVKLELTQDDLKDALNRVIEQMPEKDTEKALNEQDVHNLKDKFFISLLNNLIETDEQFSLQSSNLKLDFSYHSYICCYGKIIYRSGDLLATDRQLPVFSSSMQMIKELSAKYIPCYYVTLDAQHFALIFCYEEKPDIKDAFSEIEKILNSIRDTIQNYYNVTMRCGIGNIADEPRLISVSHNNSKQAFHSGSDWADIVFYDDISTDEHKDNKNHIVLSVKKYVNEHIRERLSLNEVAAVFGISPNYLSQLFSKHSETGFNEYVNKCKVEESKRLLMDGSMKVYEVADVLGFESSFYFSKVFKKIEGISPKDYVNR